MQRFTPTPIATPTEKRNGMIKRFRILRKLEKSSISWPTCQAVPGLTWDS